MYIVYIVVLGMARKGTGEGEEAEGGTARSGPKHPTNYNRDKMGPYLTGGAARNTKEGHPTFT